MVRRKEGGKVGARYWMNAVGKNGIAGGLAGPLEQLPGQDRLKAPPKNRPSMRTITFITTWAVLLPTMAQQTAPDDRLADLTTAAPLDRTPATMRWSGAGGRFGPGQMIDPMPLRAIVWEFGDGGLGSILPPRPWSPEEDGLESAVPMAPWREHAGGSPCVTAPDPTTEEEAPDDPHPYIIPGMEHPVLVTTGMGGKRLAVRAGDAVRTNGELAARRFASGRWELPSSGVLPQAGPLFITLVDQGTGERWYAGVVWP